MVNRTGSRALVALLGFSIFLASCASTSTLSVPIPPATTVVSGTLGGVMNTVDMVIPAGMTATVTSNLTVFASGKIEIDGTLQVAAGARLAFFATGPFILNGNIASMARARRPADT